MENADKLSICATFVFVSRRRDILQSPEFDEKVMQKEKRSNIFAMFAFFFFFFTLKKNVENESIFCILKINSM